MKPIKDNDSDRYSSQDANLSFDDISQRKPASHSEDQDQPFFPGENSLIKPFLPSELWPVRYIEINVENVQRLKAFKKKLSEVQKKTLDVINPSMVTSSKKNLIRQYTEEKINSLYVGLNQALQAQDISSGFLIIAGMLNWALETTAEKSNAQILYRGSTFGINLQVGQTFWSHSFFSTSTDRKAACKFRREVLFIIRAPARPGYSIEKLSAKPQEKEVLFSPHMKWIVTNKTLGLEHEITKQKYVQVEIAGFE